MAGGVSFFPWLLFKRFDQFISLSLSNHFLAKLTVVPSASIMLGWGKEGTNKLMEEIGIERQVKREVMGRIFLTRKCLLMQMLPASSFHGTSGTGKVKANFTVTREKQPAGTLQWSVSRSVSCLYYLKTCLRRSPFLGCLLSYIEGPVP